jgi:uncharacterized protein YbjT (DUF2867 family)
MKILVIGATGMLAKPVIRHLNKAGHQLRLFSRNIDQGMFENTHEIIQGNVFNTDELDSAISGCDAVHISLSGPNEALAAERIADAAIKNNIRLISSISGCSVAQENRWFKMIDEKYRAEQTITKSGIPYIIFRPTWFFESLDLMVRNGKAMILGKQPHPNHWVAADDYARMVAKAYPEPGAKNKIFFVHGPQKFLMKDLLEKYCRQRYPEVKKVSALPTGMIKIIASLTGNKELKEAASLFAYFNKTPEMGDPQEANNILGKPETTFEQWVQLNN